MITNPPQVWGLTKHEHRSNLFETCCTIQVFCSGLGSKCLPRYPSSFSQWRHWLHITHKWRPEVSCHRAAGCTAPLTVVIEGTNIFYLDPQLLFNSWIILCSLPASADCAVMERLVLMILSGVLFVCNIEIIINQIMKLYIQSQVLALKADVIGLVV